jgi:endonuclease/exonuclease/phosphatase family metal-dependent hydrolase
MRWIILVIAFSSNLIMPAYGAPTDLTVMSRNLYLGADVGIALEKIPDFSAAAQFMWEQVAATDFTRRAPALAKEAIDADADVIGLQEATNWYCKKNLWSKKVIVFDFTRDFLKATRDLGHEYVLASHEGIDALNIGYSIPAIPYLTLVKDPKRFQPLFGSDSAACGFEIGDAIVVKRELASQVLNVGNSEYEASYSIVPKIMTIYRGYTWIDLDFGGSKTRIVSTHLESLWDKEKIPNAAIQAKQLISDLQTTNMPLIVIGDFNSDPRDPRATSDSNPGGQPEASEVCKAQVKQPTLTSAIDTCNAYWLMRRAGFIDSGPDALNPENYSWGMNALLTGPDPIRNKAAIEMGNQYGFTDRLDYVFLKNGATVLNSRVIGNNAPERGMWATDHAGLVVKVRIPESTAISPTLDAHQPFPISFWNWVGIALLVPLSAVIYRRRRKNHG